MFQNYSAMFKVIFTIWTFAAVNSQSPLSSNFPYSSSSQSVPYSGPGSSSFSTSTSYSGASTSYVFNSGAPVSSSGSQPSFSPDSNVIVHQILSPVLDPNVETFAHSLTQVLQSSTVLNAIPNFVITDSYAFLYKFSRIILEESSILDLSFAELAGEAGREVGVVTKELYYNTLTHMLAKVLSLNSLLTQETILTYPTAVLRYVEDYGIKNGIVDAESVLKAVGYGVVDFAKSIGLMSIPNLKLAFQIFVRELKDLASGVEV